MFLDFQEIRMGPPINEVPMRTESMVMWIDDDPGQVAAELEDNLRRANEPLHGFSLQYALQRLHKSIEVARAARDAPAGTGERLRGVLRLLINDDWVLTSSGLEAVHSSAIFAPGWVVTATGDHRVQGLRGARAAIDCNAPSWMEALQWARAREATRLVFDEDDPLPPQFGQGRRG